MKSFLSFFSFSFNHFYFLALLPRVEKNMQACVTKIIGEPLVERCIALPKTHSRFFLKNRIFAKGIQYFERVLSSFVKFGVLVLGLSGGTY